MVRIGESEYRINPDVIYTGKYENRGTVRTKFYAEVKRALKTRNKK